jgi:predicted transcriptional regulator of viral defense system
VYAYNNRLSEERTVGAITVTLIKVADARLGDTEESTTREGLTVTYSSRVRTLVDAVYDWARFGSLPRAYAWITRELAHRRVKPVELVATTLRYGDLGTIRRMGALLEKRGANAGLLQKLEKALPESSGTIPWIPTRPKRGTLDRRWGLVMNGEI